MYKVFTANNPNFGMTYAIELGDFGAARVKQVVVAIKRMCIT